MSSQQQQSPRRQVIIFQRTPLSPAITTCKRRPSTRLLLIFVILVGMTVLSAVSAISTCDAFQLCSSTITTTTFSKNKQKKQACHRHRHEDWCSSTTTTATSAAVSTTTTLSRIRGGGGGALNLSPDAFRLAAETLAPKLGIITSTALYMSPIMAVIHAIRIDDMGDLNPIPLAIMSFTSISWLVYGLISQNVYVTLSNIIGAIASIGYVVGTLPLLHDRQRQRQQQQQLRLTQGIVMVGTIAVLGLWTTLGIIIIASNNNNIDQVTFSLGMFASIISIILSASPLFTIKQVISTRNSSSILGPLTLTQVINALFWTIYGLTIHNPFVHGPNIIGLFLGLIQLILKIIFPSLLSLSSKQL